MADGAKRVATMEQLEELGRVAAGRVKAGQRVGLGSGKAALAFVRALGKRVREEGLEMVGVSTSLLTEQVAREAGVPLATLDEVPALDIAIDGADEVDPRLCLIKGGGGALLREKIVAQASRQLLIVVDASKLSERLGTRWPVPVEVLPFGWRSQALFLEGLGARVTRRETREGAPYRTDQGNFILDCAFGPIEHPGQLATRLEARTGLVEHGLFIDLVTELIICGPAGLEHRRRPV